MTDSSSCPESDPDWIARRREVRVTEWQLHQELLAAARSALQNFQENSHKTTVPDITRLIELASRLGRAACGMEPGQLDGTAPTVRIELSAALKRIHSQPIEVLAEQIKQPVLPSPSPSAEPPEAQP